MSNSVIGTIVYIGGMEMPDKNAAAHRTLNNARILSALGFKVVFCGVDRFIKNDCKESLDISGFESFPARYPIGILEWMKTLFNFKHIRYVLNKYDDLKIVIAYNMHARPLAKTIQYCKKRGVKIVADVTEWYENNFSINPISFIKWIDTQKVMTNLHKKVDGIIVISTYLKDYYSKHLNSILQLPPLVDINEDVWKQNVHINNEIVEFTYAGSPEKGTKDQLGLVIKAFANIGNTANFIFNIVGITKEQFLTLFPDCTNDLGRLRDRIVFHGRLDHNKSVASLLSCDYCVFIRERSRKNMAGFPTKFVECYTSGCGLIVNDVSNIKDYVNNQPNYHIVDSTDLETICETIIKCINIGKVKHSLNTVFYYLNYLSEFKLFLSHLAENESFRCNSDGKR